MKFYYANLYAINHDIPYCKKMMREANGMVWYDTKKGLYIESAIIHVAHLVVYPKFYKQVVDLDTGFSFPRMNLSIVIPHEEMIVTEYKLYHSNQRLYVKLERRITNDELKRYYESLTMQSISIKKQSLMNLLNHEQQYWHPIQGKVSTSQYVKRLSK